MSVRLVLLGPPGSGKGTLADQLQKHVGLRHLSTGELFRREMARRSRLGKIVSRYVTSGQLVPDEVVIQVMTTQLSGSRLRRGCVLDGFPRTLGQAEGLDRVLTAKRQALTAAVSLACSESVLVTRLGGRRVCSRCGANFHMRNMPPKRPGRCDRCGSVLIIRKDDQGATIKKRLAVDRAQAKPLLAYYRRQGLLYRLNGAGTSERVLARVKGLFRRQGWLAHDRAQDS